MTRVERLEGQIKELTAGELGAFRKWFQEYVGAVWDKRIEEDALADKLDAMAAKALAGHRAGLTNE